MKIFRVDKIFLSFNIQDAYNQLYTPTASGRVGKPEDIARMCLFLCEPENNFINGQTLTIDGGATVKMIYPE